MECPSTVSQKVCIEAKVTVVPEAKIGDVNACCVGKPQFEECEKKSNGCTYMVSQKLCVRFPLTISAAVSAKPAGIICGNPTAEPSYHEDDPCEEEVLCESMEKDKLCLRPMALFEQKTEEKPCANKRMHKREWYHDAPHCRRPMMPRCGLCFLPLLCVPFCRLKHQGCKNSRRRWPVC